jgi:hypothetical protein
MSIVRAIALLLGLLSVTLAHATAQRTFVSTAGIDNPACSLAAPCRTFAAAIAAASAGGEVIVLNSGGYGTVTITQSISLIAPPGIYAGISALSGNGITINAPGANVVLRGLSIIALGGTTGVDNLQADKVTIDNCVISSFSFDGVLVRGPIDVRITDSTFRDNFNAGVEARAGAAVTVNRSSFAGNYYGIYLRSVEPSTYTAVYANETMFTRNRYGIYSYGDVDAIVRAFIARATFVGNTDCGVCVFGPATFAASAAVSDSMVAGPSGVGLAADGLSANLVISNNTVTRNTVGLSQGGGADFLSLGNNAVYANGTHDVLGNIPGILLR